jgi:hypothetical protein
MTTTRGRALFALGLRAFICAWLSALAVRQLPLGHYWGAGLAFGLLVIPVRYGWSPGLIAAVTLSYALGVLSLDLFPPETRLRTFVQASALGAFFMALALHLLGGLSRRRSALMFVLGALLGPLFWIVIGEGDGAWLRQDIAWFLAFFLWQAPMAVALTFRRKEDTLGGTA